MRGPLNESLNAVDISLIRSIVYLEELKLAEKKSLYEKAKKEMRLSERILAAIPGFHGYKEKELRRESDELIRKHLYRRLSAAKSDLRDISQRLSDRRWFEVLTGIDRLLARFDRVAAKVDHASYGYAGFFDVIKVDETDLDRMIDFDSNLFDDAEKIVKKVSEFKSEVTEGEVKKTKEYIQNLSEQLEAFEETFDKRNEVILGVD